MKMLLLLLLRLESGGASHSLCCFWIGPRGLWGVVFPATPSEATWTGMPGLSLPNEVLGAKRE